MAEKIEIRINTVFTSGATPGMQRFMEILPNLKKDIWRKTPSINTFEEGYVNLMRTPGKDALFILPKSELSRLYRYWMNTTLELGGAIIIMENDDLSLYHQTLGHTPDEAQLFTEGKGKLFAKAELTPY